MMVRRIATNATFSLKSKAQVSAACALSRVLRHEACLTAMDQHFSGGMHILVSLLYKPDPELQTALCGVVANCACRDHMLQVLTEEVSSLYARSSTRLLLGTLRCTMQQSMPVQTRLVEFAGWSECK